MPIRGDVDEQPHEETIIPPIPCSERGCSRPDEIACHAGRCSECCRRLCKPGECERAEIGGEG